MTKISNSLYTQSKHTICAKKCGSRNTFSDLGWETGMSKGKFRMQYSVGPYALDFYCPALQSAIEVEGDSHYNPADVNEDRIRQDFID